MLVKVTVPPLKTTLRVCPPRVVEKEVLVGVASVTTTGTEAAPPQLPVKGRLPDTCVPTWVNENVPLTQQQEPVLHVDVT
jgi:hypothetical protein